MRYESSEEVEADMKLVFDNAIKYNPKDNEIHLLAVDFKTRFEEVWAHNKAALPLNCALKSNNAKTPAAKAKSAANAKAAQANSQSPL